MISTFRAEIMGEIFIFGGHALVLFLLSDRRYAARLSVIVWGSVFLVSALCAVISLVWFEPRTAMINHLISLGICLLAFMITSKGSVTRNLFLFATYINFLLLSLAISQSLSSQYMDNDPLATIMFRLMLLSVFCFEVTYDIRPALLRATKQISRGWGPLTILVCIFCGCLMALAFMSNLFFNVDSQMLVILAVLSIIMVSAYVVIFITINIMSKEVKSNQLQLEKHFLSQQLDSYAHMEREAQKYRHDFRHHNLMILEYAKNGDCASIVDYLQNYEKSTNEKLNFSVCANQTVNSIVTAFLKQANHYGIRMDTHIFMRSKTAVQDIDMVAILANLLENAMKGCLLAEDHWIDLSISHKGQKLIIKCKNSCVENIRFQNGLPQSAVRQGIGIKSIVDTAAIYAGNTDFFAENGVFTSCVLLNDSTESTK